MTTPGFGDSRGSGMSGIVGVQGKRFPLSAMSAYDESPPPAAQVKVNGRTPAERMASLRQQHRDAVRRKQLDRHGAVLSGSIERIKDADDTLDVLDERLDEWLTDMRSGALDPAAMLRNIGECAPVINAVRDAYDSVGRDREAADAMVDTDPVDYEAELLGRFPLLQQSLPVVTEAWLRGEPGAADPLAEPAEPA